MSGHSHWSKIKRQKGATDAKKGKVFAKHGRLITTAARLGGGDPEMNPRLRLAMDKARADGMPKDNVERAIKRATGEGGADALQEIVYEGYGPSGIAILVEALTDNRNRTVSDLRHAFSTAGGSLGEAGSVAWLFETRGVIAIDANGADADELALRAIDAGADDVKVEDGTVEVYTSPDKLEAVRAALADDSTKVISSEIANVPKTTVQLETNQAGSVLRLLDKLDDLDDVQRVSSNADFPDEVLAAYA